MTGYLPDGTMGAGDRTLPVVFFLGPGDQNLPSEKLIKQGIPMGARPLLPVAKSLNMP